MSLRETERNGASAHASEKDSKRKCMCVTSEETNRWRTREQGCVCTCVRKREREGKKVGEKRAQERKKERKNHRERRPERRQEKEGNVREIRAQADSHHNHIPTTINMIKT